MKYNHILIQNIYYMLSYAFTVLRREPYRDIQAEPFEHTANLFAAILSRGIGLVTKHGLYRGYMEKMEDLTTVHGKIEMVGTIRNRLRRQRILTCSYDDLSGDNLPNRILKSTMLLLLRSDEVEQAYKDKLKQELFYFSRVQVVDLRRISWNHIFIPAHHRTYQMLLAICRFVVEDWLPTTESGLHRLPFYKDEQHLSRLYEKFLLEYYSQEYAARIRGFSCRAAHIPWDIAGPVPEHLPAMRSDVTLSYGNKVLIIDAKYYSHTMRMRYEKRAFHSAHLYQIFAYVKNEAAENPHQTVSGMLLYAKTDETIVPDDSFMVGENRFSVKTLDLNCKFDDIRAQLDSIIQSHFPEVMQ